MDSKVKRHRRRSDDGVLCWIAARAGQFWDFIDKRQIDAYCLSLVILYYTIDIIRWAKAFASATSPSLEGAAVIAAVAAPYMALQAAAIKFLFDARKGSFQP